MQLTIAGKKYTIVFSVAATLCDEVLETVVSLARDSDGDAYAMAGNLPSMTRSLFYGGLLQMHGSHGDNSVKSKFDSDELLFQYLTETPKANLTSLFKSLYEQLGEDNFLSRIGLSENEDNNPKPSKKSEKITPIQTVEGGGES